MADRLTDDGNAYCPDTFVDQEVRSTRKTEKETSGWKLLCACFNTQSWFK